MIPVTAFKDRKVAVFGLGGSGLATAEALVAGGAEVVAFDDAEASRLKAQDRGIPVADLRNHDFASFSTLVLAPGVPLTHPEPHWTVSLARASGIEVIGDVELFARQRRAVAPGAPFVAITGTNGKSTTTALIAHMLRSAGRDVEIGGNFGPAILGLRPFDDGRAYVIECSSFQIDLAPSLDASVGVHLNLTEDHLDRHGTIEGYAAVKERLVQGAAIAVVGVDDGWSLAMAERREARGLETLRISVQEAVKSGVWAVGGRIVEPHGLAQTVVADLSGHPVLKGSHNAQNAAAAVAATRALGVGLDEVRAGLASFPGLAHRMEPIGRAGPVTIVNDSKATNADAAAKALASFERIHWILGGRPKTGGIESLVGYFPRIARAYLIGEAAQAFSETLGPAVPHEICVTMDKAVEAAVGRAVEDGVEAVVLLSPASASFDQYRNFEVRGDHFRSLVAAHPLVKPFQEGT